MYNDRIGRLQQLISQQQVDALIVIPGPSMYYLTGLSFHLMERPVLGIFPKSGTPVFFLPELELVKLEASPLQLTPVTYDENPASQEQALQKALSKVGLNSDSTLAVEPLRFRFFELELIRRSAPGIEVRSAKGLTSQLRLIKDQAELAAMQRAVDIAEAALTDALPLVKPGMTEQELQAELVVQLLRHGSEPDLPFHPIVASGPNSALPHADASERTLGAGDFLLIDWGASHQGYCSDLTRTFALGEASDEMRSIHQAVFEANQAGRNAIAPGVQAGELDRQARQVIETAGYGPRFTHRLGHGLGLEPHEPPYLYGENEAELQPGMTFTVEPGVYVHGFGGVRIEDDVVVTESGGESLSQISRALEVIA